MAGFAVTEILPAEAITPAPHFGYPITIDLAPALPPHPASTPDHSTHGQPAEADREASPSWGGASSSFANAARGMVVSAFGELRGLLDLASPVLPAVSADKSSVAAVSTRSAGERKKWWGFRAAMLTGALLTVAASAHASPLYFGGLKVEPAPRGTPIAFTHAVEARGVNGASLHLEAALAPPPGQFASVQQMNPCKGQTKLYVSINQTANTQLAAGTPGNKIYVCSIHVVVAAATSVALVEGTGTVCATGTAGVSGFGGATAATGWNFAANGGIVLGNGDVAVGAEGTSGDSLCLYNSGSGQVSGGISYVVQ
jgi:hypothetical protein